MIVTLIKINNADVSTTQLLFFHLEAIGEKLTIPKTFMIPLFEDLLLVGFHHNLDYIL
jgi:hypothetical protein